MAKRKAKGGEMVLTTIAWGFCALFVLFLLIGNEGAEEIRGGARGAGENLHSAVLD